MPIPALSDLGRQVPGDISVVGYDGIPLSQFSVPRASSSSVVKSLQRHCPPVHGVVPFQLIPGGSVAPPRAGP